MRLSCSWSFSTNDNHVGMSRLFSLPTTHILFNQRFKTKQRRPLSDMATKLPAPQVPLVRDEGLKVGHDALPAFAGCPERGGHLSASRAGCGSFLGCRGR